MNYASRFAAVLLTFACTLCRGADAAPKVLFDPAQPGALEQIVANEKFGETSFAIKDGAIEVAVKANGQSSFPGIMLTPSKPWDASEFGHLEVTITNNGAKPIRPSLRIDSTGSGKESPSSTSAVSLKPGESKTLTVIFGYSYGKKGPFKPEAITKAIVFTGKSDVEQSFRISAIRAAGSAGEKPLIDPATVAAKPANGQIMGGSAAFDAARQAIARGGAKVTADGKSFTASFSAAGQSVLIKPVTGMWNLSDQLQVRVRVRNTGATAATPAVQLESRPGAASPATAAAPIAPGKEGDIVASFVPVRPWKGADLPEMKVADGPAHGFTEFEPGTGSKYASNVTTGIAISADAAASLQVLSVVAEMPPQPRLPEWLGKRPPVEGDWTLTFEDNFDGSSIDLKKWNIYSEGEWHLGKATAYSKDNVIVKDGKLALRVEKRQTHHNDNPDYALHDYATGNCDTYGKWTQRYGYFEARLKLPKAPDAFTAFWLMPDRGLEYAAAKKPAFGESRTYQRNSTNGNGMEFDIMEQLSIWGPNRHDFGMHWDHYMKNHKSIGTFSCYFQPDAEGYLTVGMLWTPGSVVMYQQGREASRWETSRISNIPSYMILQHITGGWETEGMDDAQLPSDMLFDYIRVWQRKDLASPVDGPKPNDGGPLAPK